MIILKKKVQEAKKILESLDKFLLVTRDVRREITPEPTVHYRLFSTGSMPKIQIDDLTEQNYNQFENELLSATISVFKKYGGH